MALPTKIYYSDEVADFTLEDWVTTQALWKHLRQQREARLGTFLPQPAPEEQLLDSLAERYEQGCHAYDSQICSGMSPRTGDPIPIYPDEARASHQHARMLFDELVTANAVEPEALRRAIQRYNLRNN